MKIVFVLTGLVVGGIGAVRIIFQSSIIDGYFIGALGAVILLFGLFKSN